MKRPLVSVLMPSRNRVDMARESIESLGQDDFEVLLYIDNDDPQLDEYMLLEYPFVIKVVGERHGYHNFHLMVNELSTKARSKWLLLWNDDALMDTQDWLGAIEEQVSAELAVYNFFDPQNSTNNLFPLTSKRLVDSLGHFSLNTHCDSWVQDMANELNIHKPIYGISARHIRDRVNDETKSESQAAYKTTSPQYSSPETQELWRNDVNIIKEMLHD